MKLLHCLPLQYAFRKTKRTETIEDMKSELCVNDDLIYEILQRLLIKDLLRFKSVCKSWKKMIEDPYLALKQLQRPAQETDMKLMVHYSMSGIKEFTAVISNEMIEIATPENESHLLACDCNGLYLFYHHSDHSLPVTLFNPVTQETIQLPHDSTLAYAHGLGFDVGNTVFKVIRFTIDLDQVCRKPEVLILGQKSWKQLELPACLHGVPHRRTIFLNGAIHCLFRTPGPHGDYILIAFDVMKEEFRSIKFPNISVSDCRLMNIGGSLAMYLRRNDAALESYNVYLLKDYNKGDWQVESDLAITYEANDNSPMVSGIVGNQIILYSFGSDHFFDMETRQRTVKRQMVQITHFSPMLVNAPLINQLTLLPLSQYRTTCVKQKNKLRRLQWNVKNRRMERQMRDFGASVDCIGLGCLKVQGN